MSDTKAIIKIEKLTQVSQKSSLGFPSALYNTLASA